MSASYQVRVTKRGQVTLPKATRERYGLQPGDELTVIPRQVHQPTQAIQLVYRLVDLVYPLCGGKRDGNRRFV
jgi:AbrB family looped-hinge helix DNA binding protein